MPREAEFRSACPHCKEVFESPDDYPQWADVMHVQGCNWERTTEHTLMFLTRDNGFRMESRNVSDHRPVADESAFVALSDAIRRCAAAGITVKELEERLSVKRLPLLDRRVRMAISQLDHRGIRAETLSSDLLVPIIKKLIQERRTRGSTEG